MLLRTYSEPDTVLSVLQILSFTTLGGSYCYTLEDRAQKGTLSCPRSHS